MSPVQVAPWGGAGASRRDRARATIRHAAVTAGIVLGAPLFIACLAVAGAAVPEALRSPLLETGLLTRDATVASDMTREVAAPVAERARARRVAGVVAGPATDDQPREADERRTATAGDGGTGADGGAGSSSPLDAGLETAPAAGDGIATADQGVAAAPTGDRPPAADDAADTAAVPSPVDHGLQEVDETVRQLEEAIGSAPLGQSSDGVPPVGGAD